MYSYITNASMGKAGKYSYQSNTKKGEESRTRHREGAKVVRYASKVRRRGYGSISIMSYTLRHRTYIALYTVMIASVSA